MRTAVLLALLASPLVADSGEEMFRAARAGDLAKVDALLAQGVSPNGREPMGGTPLHAAAQTGHKEIVERLIAAGAEVDAHHALDRATPLHFGVTGNHPDIVELLLAHRADPNAPYGAGLTALHLAASRGYTRIGSLLIAKGAAVDVRAGDGGTPLEDAARRGVTEMVRLLLASGADPNAANPRNGQTPLHLAAMNDQSAAAAVLMEAGARADARDRNGTTPLDSAIQFQQRETLGTLLDHGANFDMAGALHAAVLRGQLPMLRLLIDRVIPAQARALLSDAALKGHSQIVGFLLDHKADVNGLNQDGATPLHDAALGGSRDVAALLLKRGASLAARDRATGATALHVAASWGRREVVTLLISAGADAAAKDNSGHTPLDLAVANSQNEIAALLRQPRSTPARVR